jgi:tripartite-type tricarboxylate transporter receptor subunit TctC
MRFALGILLAACTTLVQAQSWPSRPLRIIVGYAPGVPSDTLARSLAEPLGKALAQPVIVENRVGADGIIAMEACSKATPDGYTLCTTTSGVIIWHPLLRNNLPYDPLRDLAPLHHGGFFDSALVAHPSVPAATVQQLVEHAKANPGKLNWGHFGPQSTGYMYGEWLKRGRGAPLFVVPYKTQPQLIQAIVVNESQLAVYGLANAEPHLKSGKIKALAVTAPRRLEWLPNVPTFEEEGIKLPLRAWFGHHVPARVPREVAARLGGELRRISEEPAFRSGVLARLGLVDGIATAEEFDAFIRSQVKSAAELATFIGLKPE